MGFDLGGLGDKAKDLLDEHGDKVEGAVDKIGDVAKDKLGHEDTVDNVTEKIKNAIPGGQ
jgi:hypothetical protein